MPNGDDLIGIVWASQGALIVQKPGSDHLYYVFTVGGDDEYLGLHYSIVDMHLDGGLGDVTEEKNIPLISLMRILPIPMGLLPVF